MQGRQSFQTSGEFVDLRDYAAALRRWAWVIITLTALGLGLAFGYSEIQTPIYTAMAKVLINPPPGNATQNLYNTISVDTEAQVVESAPIATAAGAAMGASPPFTQLLKHVSVETTADTFILGIAYSDPEPAQAARGANAFAMAYLDYKQQQTETQTTQQQASIESQIAELQREQREQNRILETYPAGTIEYRNARDVLSQLSIRLALLASSLAELPQFVNPGQIILPAAAPRSPSSPKVPLNAALGLLLGLFGGVVAAFVLDRIDDRVHRGADLQFYLDAPVLAYVPHARGSRHQRPQLVLELEPRSPVAESYRTIRTNVLSMADKQGVKVIAIASPMQREGKSMTAANLSAALGQTDKRVLVISMDIRKPRIHEFFRLQNERGLSDILTGEASLGDVILKSETANVWLIPGGRVPQQPAELLQSPAMSSLLAEVRSTFDFAVIDCPPVLGLADCLAVLPLVDAVLLVVKAGRTRGGTIIEAVDQLERVGVSVDAAIMNDVRVRRGRPGHHAYGYYRASDRASHATSLRNEPEPPVPTRLAPSPYVSSVPNENGAVGDDEGSKRGAEGRTRTKPA